MKYKITSFIFFLSFIICNAQNSELDKRNGFKQIKLGTDIEQFENLSISSKNKFKTIAFWTPPKNSDSSYLFEDKIDVIELTFNSTNKLSKIKISLYKNVKSGDNTLTNKFKYINEKLISVLGKPSSMPKELLERLNNGTYINLKWSGKKTILFLFFKVEDKYMNKNDEFILTQTINLLFMDKNQKEEYSAGF